LKIQNTRKISEKISSMIEINQLSAAVNTFLNNTIKRNSIMPSDIQKLRDDALQYRKNMSLYGKYTLSEDETMLLLLIESLMASQFGNEPQIMEFFMSLIAKEMKIFNVKDFSDNPYIKNIVYDNHIRGDYELKYNEIMPYELDIYNIPKRINEMHINIPRICCFDEEFKFPAITQNSIKSTWMSISPNEVFTMEAAIKNARGRVLTLGCGMGYFAYMASLKEEVDSVTIIELEDDVIELFDSFVYPQFINKDKVKVIKADAVEYLNSLDDGIYDYCFADIWIGAEDIEPYFAVKEAGRRFNKMRIDYWIEDTFAIYLADFVYLEMINTFSDMNNIKLNDISCLISNREEKIGKYIKKLMTDVEITRPEHIDYYLTPENVIHMINSSNIVFDE